ncbi:MAG: acyloxyacyl hydrolase [Opitutaceae bacterium]|nr:acyloxyacyl hydrolase [Cytophagales bacterium]
MSGKFLIVFTFFLFTSFLSANAQNGVDSIQIPKKYSKFLSASINQGWIWKHRKSLSGLPEAYPKGVEINFGWQTNGRKAWNQYHNFPRWGINFLYYNLDNPHVYGQSIHIAPYIDLFALKSKRHELYFKIGTGIAFYPTHYDKDKNSENVLVSLPFCATGLFGINYRFIFSPYWSGLISANFNHASNGSMRQPNFGINIPGFGAGIHYTFNPERVVFIKRELAPVIKSWNFNANLSFSVRQAPSDTLNDVYYPAYTLTTYASKRLTRKSIVVAGIDGCLDQSLNYTLRNVPEYKDGTYSIYRFAVTAGYEFVLTEKTHIMIQNAFYLYNPFKEDIPVYQRYGFKYMPIEHLYFGYFLKTHAGKADFWEFAVGVRI